MSVMTEPPEHPSFTLARSLPEPWRSHFPKSDEEVQEWEPYTHAVALAPRVLVVMETRIECAWAAYVDTVLGISHGMEADSVLANGDKLREHLARVLFPQMKGVPYAN